MRLGLLTIGQSPRTDITFELRPHLPEDVIIVEAGVLDGMDHEKVQRELCPEGNDIIYVSRMLDGSQVKLSKSKLIPRMQQKVEELEGKGAELIAILCSGEFPDFKSRTPLIYPDKILKGLAASLSHIERAGVLIPAEEQVQYAKKKWESFFSHLDVMPISPYTSKESDFIAIAKAISGLGTKLVIMDCIGYTAAQRGIIKELTGALVLSSRSALFGTLRGLLS